MTAKCRCLRCDGRVPLFRGKRVHEGERWLCRECVLAARLVAALDDVPPMPTSWYDPELLERVNAVMAELTQASKRRVPSVSDAAEALAVAGLSDRDIAMVLHTTPASVRSVLRPKRSRGSAAPEQQPELCDRCCSTKHWCSGRGDASAWSRK